MSILARLACFLVFIVHTFSCRGNCHAWQQPVAGITGKSWAKSVLRLSAKKDRLGDQSGVALHSCITASALSFMLKPGGPQLWGLPVAFDDRLDTPLCCPGIARGIVAGLKAKMLFPVHYFW